MMKRLVWLTAFAISIATAVPGLAGDIDRSVADFKTPAENELPRSKLRGIRTNGANNRSELRGIRPTEIKWVRNAAGTNESAVLFGDPSKVGPYVLRTKWFPGNLSRPHFHPNDRFFVVISGTWWMGTGEKFDPDSTVPVPAGSYAIHYGNKIHYDGAKNEEVVIQVWGMGPATSTPAEKR